MPKLYAHGHSQVSLFLTLNIFTPCSSITIAYFKQVIAGWETKKLLIATHTTPSKKLSS